MQGSMRYGERLATAALAAVFVCSGAGELAGQEVATRSGTADERRERPVARARPTGAPMVVDGRLSEAAWDSAAPVRGFVQAEPAEGAAPARPTTVRVLYDREALYVGARLHDDSAAVRDQLVRRDAGGAYDFFRFEVDPNGDRRTGYLFQVSAAGAERDAYLHDDVQVDESFDAVWASAVRRDSAGWTAELRIPLSEIEFRAADSTQTWGVNFVRRRLASNSTSMFALRSRTRAGRVSQYGRLRGVRVRSGGGLELAPYLATRAVSAPADPADPFFDGSSLEPRAGLDLSWSPASNVTVDATFNPDFGQVEVDPAVVNLTAFETFFPERRPFFTENARLFDFRLSGPHRILFHSRRIGRAPVGSGPDSAAFTDVPRRSTILGAAKVTGRTASGLSFGLLGSVTAEEEGRASFPGTGRRSSFVAQPRETYGVARVRQDLRDGATTVGAILGGVHRTLPASARFDRLPETAVAGGIDFEHQWGGGRNRRYALWGYVSGSYVTGTPASLVDVQTDANHYFQRPDADYKDVDSTATRMTGREWRLQIERRSAEHWTWQAWVNEVSPGYVVDDVGFAGSTLPRIDLGGQLRYQDVEPGPLFRSWSLRLNTFHNFRHSLVDRLFDPSQWAESHAGGRFLLGGDFHLRNNWRVRLSTEYAPEHDTERETRGGPLMTDPGSYALQAQVGTDPRLPLSLAALGGFREHLGGGHELTGQLRLEARPASNWEVSIGPSYTHLRDAAQFVTSTNRIPYSPTLGTRYLFADVTRDELGLETRVDVAFTPDLSLQLFAQPLLATADFTRYKQLRRPRSFDFLPFEEGTAVIEGGEVSWCRTGRTCEAGGRRHVDLDGDGSLDVSFEERDFDLASLRGNAVLRWEYRPGSQLFLVWQQDRRSRVGEDAFAPLDGLERLIDAESSDRFILKIRQRLAF